MGGENPSLLPSNRLHPSHISNPLLQAKSSHRYSRSVGTFWGLELQADTPWNSRKTPQPVGTTVTVIVFYKRQFGWTSQGIMDQNY